MDHQSFRYYLPGILFLLPIYCVICWITVNNYTDSDIRVFVLLGGITTFPVIALPIGWWIYNTYRVWWLIFTKGGYENKDFVKLICKDTKPFYSPQTQSVLIDFSHIKNIGSWIKFDIDIFRRTFYPFTSKTNFEKEIQQKGVRPKFMEALSDYILFQENGYDYARSISTVRYGLESSIFALTLSGFYAFGLRAIWQYQLHITTNKAIFIIWVFLVIIISICILITLFIRWKIADREYDARLLLTTSTSLKSNYFNIDQFNKNIPKEILENIYNLNITDRPYAAFDLDNTLLLGDIGEAVFASMVKTRTIQNFDWTNYLSLIEENREAAYKRIIELMNGLNLSELKKVTKEIINSNDTTIEIGENKIPLPKPNPIMQSIVSLLMTRGIDIYIVTASNKISAEIICWKYFGIPASNVLGAEIEIDGKNKITFNSTEIPYAEGKVAVLKKAQKGRPIITGGDGIWDKFLLDFTTPEGIRFWLGKSDVEYINLKEKLYKDLLFYQIASDKNFRN